MGAHKAWGIKGPVEGAQVRDSPVPGLGDKTFLARSLGPQEPETMLLWLTLTILWSTTCWADQIYGNGRGTYFSSSPDNTNDISGIRVSLSPIGIIRSIQLRYGSNWSETYGVSGGRAEEFLLWPDEYIVGLVGSYRIYLRYLVVYTNMGRWAAFGKESGYSFTAYPGEPGKVLTGLFGQTQLLGITGIGFKWDYPIAEPTPAPSSTTQNNETSNEG